MSDRLAARVAELLADARSAHAAGDGRQQRALAQAVLALDPGNAEAEALLVGPAHRRQLTLLFCDLVGSTAIADGLDPEEMAEILREYRSLCAAAIERWGGFVGDHQGDGVLVHFGYPEVHEDDARRAVYAGLEIVRAVGSRADFFRSTYGVEIHVRIAIHTDLVVMDAAGVVGPAANEASRLQAFAEPDTVLISDTTHALVKGYFEVDSMGAMALRGVSRRVEIFTVRGELADERLFAATTLSPFAGRRAELDRIETLWHGATDAWERAVGDAARATPAALLVTGDPGIGKSRLILEATRTAGIPCFACRCSGYHETTSLYALRDLLADICDVRAGDGPAERVTKLRAALGTASTGDSDLPLLAAALSIPASAISPPADVDPSMLRTMAVHSAAALVQATVTDGPIALFVDDLHWADESTLDVLSVLLSTPRPGLLILLAAREGFVPPWPEDAVPRLHLRPLARAELEQITLLMPEGALLGEERRDELIARSDGVPLFLEELVRTADAPAAAGVSRRTGRYADYDIPAALRDPLLARLTSPNVALELAQLASTVGREVERDFLQRVACLDDASFRAQLRTLVHAGIVDASATGTIRFRHELIREVAYETQRRAACRERHGRVADHLLSDGAGEHPRDAGATAFHLEKAERYAEALDARLRSAAAAQGLGAHKEAMAELTHALGLLGHLPRGAPAMQTELTIRQLRSFSAVIARGYAATEAAEDQARCLDLCRRLGLGPEVLPSLVTGWSYYSFKGELDAAQRACDAMVQAVDGNGLAFPAGAMTRGIMGFFRGRFRAARESLDAFVEDPWGDTPRHPPPEWPLPNDALVAGLSHLVATRWVTGDRCGADAAAERALARAEGLAFPYNAFSVGYVKSQVAVIRRLEGDHEAVLANAESMIEIGERHGFVLWGLAGALQRGISVVQLGDHSALPALLDLLTTWRRLLMADLWSPYLLTHVAEAQATAGRQAAARAGLDEALVVAHRTGSDFYSAETLRLRGRLRIERGDVEGGLADLRSALERARRQGAAAFELRAAVALARVSSGTDTDDALGHALGQFAPNARGAELDEARLLARR